MNESGASVAFPIPDHLNQLIQELNAPEGQRFGVLFSYAKGVKTTRFSTDVSYLIGLALAKVHKATEDFSLDRIHYDSESLLTNAVVSLKQFFPAATDEILFLKKDVLPYACLAIMVYYIGVQCDRFSYWTNIFVNEDHLKRMVGNLKRWINFNSIAIQETSC